MLNAAMYINLTDIIMSGKKPEDRVHIYMIPFLCESRTV